MSIKTKIILNITTMSVTFYLSVLFSFFSIVSFAQKKTQYVTVSRIIEAPASSVWKVVGEEFGDIQKSHPLIVSSNYTNNVNHGCEGAERVCNLTLDGSRYIKEKQVDFNSDNYSFKVQVMSTGGIPLVPELSYATYKVEPINDEESRLVFEFNFRTKPAFMGHFAKGKFKKQLYDYMVAVDHYISTGEEVNADNFDAIKKQYESK